MNETKVKTVSRADAQVGANVKLGMAFKPTPPAEILVVTVWRLEDDADNTTTSDGVLVESFGDEEIERAAKDEYYVTVPADKLRTGRHVDEWFFRWAKNDSIHQVTRDFCVGPAVEEGGGE